MLETLKLDDLQRDKLDYCLFAAECNCYFLPWHGPDDVCLFIVADDYHLCALARLLLLSDVCKFPIC